MNVRVVFVEPGYSANTGALCRVMKNFGFSELTLVNPRCEVRGIDAYKGAKHAKDVLENAKIANSFEDAAKGCDFVIGTTGIKMRNRGTIRSAVFLREFLRKINYYEGKKVALVFGREGTGLNKDELDRCDILLHIEAAPQYPVLNISHAAAVILYSISKFKSESVERPAHESEIVALKRYFSEISGRFKRRNMRASVAFRRIISRAQINEHEAKALLNLFRLIGERL